MYDSLHWSGQARFLTQNFEPWKFVNSKGDTIRGGEFKMTGNLALVTIDQAGHMCPMDQPEAGIVIMKRWFEELSLAG